MLRAMPGPSILVVDWDDDVREALETALSGEGYEIRGAGTLEAALGQLDERSFHVVLADAFARSLADELSPLQPLVDRARPIPVVAMSAWPIPPAAAGPAGCRSILRKPFDLSQAVAAVAEAMEEELDPRNDPRARIAARYFDALSRSDWPALGDLCTDDVAYVLPGTTPFALAIRGREAFLEFSRTTFANFPGARFEDLHSFPTPAGVATRYLGSWSAPDGSQKSQAGAVLLHLRDGRIERIGVSLNDDGLLRRVRGDRAPSER